MQIDADVLGVIATFLTLAGGGVFAWMRLNRRVDAKIGRKEFQDILERRDTRVSDDLKEVLRKLEQQNETSAEYRALSAEKLENLAKDLAVLKDRAGQRRVTKR